MRLPTMGRVLPLLVAYALILAFLVVERALRDGQRAKSFKREATDRGSTALVGAAFGASLIALVVAVFLPRTIPGSYATPLCWLGVALMAPGLLLRVWAARTLGTFYTRTLVVTDKQRLVDVGPYRILRHPGYSGTLLLWFGAGLASGNVWVLAFILLCVVPAYVYRTAAEERMLRERFGTAFEAYTRHRWRLIPLIF